MAAVIAAQRDEHRIPQAVSCRALGVSQSWFYKWRDGDAAPGRRRRAALAAEVTRLRAAPAALAAMRAATARLARPTAAAAIATLLAELVAAPGIVPDAGRRSGQNPSASVPAHV